MHRRVSELAERLRRERRAGADRAVEDDGRLAVRDGALDARLEVAARDVNGARNVAFGPFVALAHVDPDGAFDLLGAAYVDFRNLGLGGLEELAICAHNPVNGSRSLLHS